MKYNPNKHNRRSIRLKDYDYSQIGYYFITLNCQDRYPLFGNIQNGIMCLNTFGTILHENWMKTPKIRPNVAIGAFVVMPDHFHAIIRIKESKGSKNAIGKFQSPSQTIGAIVRGLKGAVTKEIKATARAWNSDSKGDRKGELQVAPTIAPVVTPTIPPKPIPPGPTHLITTKSIWQRDYHDRIISDQKSLSNITNYINNNPANWKK